LVDMLRGLDHYVEIVAPEFGGATFVTGFHGVGHVGWIAVRHLVKSLGAEKIGYVVSRHMQPFVYVRNGIVLPYELYRYGETVFLLTNVPFTGRDSVLVPMFVAEKVSRSFRESILIGGLDSRRRSGEGEELRIAPTSRFAEERRDVVERYRVLEEDLGIVGPLATFMSILEARGAPGLAVLPYAAVERPDPGAAAKAVEFVSSLLGLDVDTRELVEEGMMVEKAVEEIEKKLKEAMRERDAPPYYI